MARGQERGGDPRPVGVATAPWSMNIAYFFTTKVTELAASCSPAFTSPLTT